MAWKSFGTAVVIWHRTNEAGVIRLLTLCVGLLHRMQCELQCLRCSRSVASPPSSSLKWWNHAKTQRQTSHRVKSLDRRHSLKKSLGWPRRTVIRLVTECQIKASSSSVFILISSFFNAPSYGRPLRDDPVSIAGKLSAAVSRAVAPHLALKLSRRGVGPASEFASVPSRGHPSRVPWTKEERLSPGFDFTAPRSYFFSDDGVCVTSIFIWSSDALRSSREPRDCSPRVKPTAPLLFISSVAEPLPVSAPCARSSLSTSPPLPAVFHLSLCSCQSVCECKLWGRKLDTWLLHFAGAEQTS